jgi:hypothetical protein
VHLDDIFVSLVALRDIVMVVIFILAGGGVVAALPVVAVDDEHVLDVEVVGVELVTVLFVLVLEEALHRPDLSLGVDHVDGPLLTPLLLPDD